MRAEGSHCQNSDFKSHNPQVEQLNKSGLFRSAVRNFLLEGIPNSFVTYETFVVSWKLTSCVKTCAAIWNFWLGIGLSTHKSPS